MRLAYDTHLPRPRADVVALFRDPSLRPRWQPGLVVIRPLAGTPGEAGARSELVCSLGPRRVVMIETVTACAPPEHFAADYAVEGVANRVTHRFTPAGNGTRWELTSEFTLPPVMGLVAPWLLPILRGQVERTVDGFRDFVIATAPPASP